MITKSRLIALLSSIILLSFLGVAPADATVELNWPQGTPNQCKNATDAFFAFETGIEEAQIESSIPGVEFTTTHGINWRYADIRTGKYNYPAYAANGNFIAWLGVSGDSGRISFTGGTANYVSVLVSTYSGVSLDAYDTNGNLLASSGYATNNLNTGTFTRLTVEAQGIAYVMIHDTGNYWIMDDLCTDAPPPCLPVQGHATGSHDERIDLIFVPDEDYNGDMAAFLNDVANNITNRLGAVAPTDNNLNRFNFYYTNLVGNVTSTEIGDAQSNCGQLGSLPTNLLNQCPYADAVVVLHRATFSDCNRTSGAVGVFSAEGALGRSFIHEGGHGIFGLRDEYDSNRSSGSCNYTAYNTNRPLPSNIWDTEANCRVDSQAQGWDPDQCYQFTPCQSDWWKLGDPSLANDNDRYNDANFRFIMFDGTYFNNGFGVGAERRINWVFDQLPVTPEPPLPPPSSEKSVILELHINDTGMGLLKSGFVVAPPPTYLPGEYSLTANTFSITGSLLGKYGFADPRIVQAEYDYTGPFTLGSADFTLVLPYFNRIGTVDIVDTKTSALLLSVDVSNFSSVENNSPISNAGMDKDISVGDDCSATLVLDGKGSYDPDGDDIAYTWTGPFGSANGPTPTVSLSLGTHSITLTVADAGGLESSDTVVITVKDNTSPNIASLSATPALLWPPNHLMTPVLIGASVYDNCDPNPLCRITSVTSSEPVNGLGDGDTAPDWEIGANLNVQLRAERSGRGNGREYYIVTTCTDTSGNSSVSDVAVKVPSDMGRKQQKQK